MSGRPTLDERDREALLARMTAIAPHYVPEWDPDSEDAGTVLFEVFADMAEDVLERLNRVPQKHQMAFLDALDFRPYPPQPSRLPVTFALADSATENVRVPEGTTVIAPEAPDRPEQRFETVAAGGFEVTPGSITDVYGVDPGVDRIVDHGSSLAAAERTDLFVGPNEQTHAWYLGHADVLTVSPGATLELHLRTNAPVQAVRDYVVWEYYGTSPDGDGPEGWYELDVEGRREPTVGTLSEYRQVSQLLDRIESVFNRQGLTRATDGGNAGELIRAIADDVRKGRFGGDDAPGRPALPVNFLDPSAIDEPLRGRLGRQCSILQERLVSAATGRHFAETTEESVTLEVTVPGEPTECEVDGVESRWLRCRIPEGELAPALFNVVVDRVSVSVGTGPEADGRPIDEAFVNDVELDPEAERLRPFGPEPTEGATFALACEEVFTKAGATARLAFERPADAADVDLETKPEVNWQYWDGAGWRRLDVADGTASLRRSGTVEFRVPDDIEPTEVMGHEGRWIQAELVGGDYGEARIELTGENNWERVTDDVTPPEYADVTVEYDLDRMPFDRVRCQNNVTYRSVDPSEGDFRPFVAPPGETQALYLGFDAPLRNGPIPLYVSVEGTVYPDGFAPWLTVEYCSNPRTGEWSKVDAADRTEDLTERGVIELTLPEETTAFELFGSTRHWIRLSVTGDEFARSTRRVFVATDATDATMPPGGAERDGPVGDADRPLQPPPVVDRLRANTHWVENVRTVEAERLGSSSGTADQTFSVRDPPVLEGSLWVDELSSLADRERRALLARDPDRVRVERDGNGDPRRFWVRWTAVRDFYESDAEDRHYVLDRTAGTVRFGNGKRGRIPPTGENNVEMTYRTGGGAAGDVEAGAVSVLADPVRHVDAVGNPEAGDGGEDEESIDEIVSRAPKQLRDRETPVTRDGFERIAASVSRDIARVHCEPGLTDRTTTEPGCITLVIIPETDERKPAPSVDLINRVETEMRERAPATLIGADRSALTVTGPNYVRASVDVTVEPAGTRSVTELTERITDELSAFLHPLTGGPTGEGWPIGSVPDPAVIGAHLEGLSAINRVTSITVTFTDDGEEFVLSGNDEAVPVAPDVLVYSGRHDVTVSTGEDAT